MFTTPITIAGKEYSLRYTIKQQKDIKTNAPKKLLSHIKGLIFNSPMDILPHIDNVDVQVYLLQKGLEWDGSGAGKISEDDAAQLRQDYLEEGEADAGEKYESFLALLGDAVAKNVVGASGKKLQEKAESKKTEARTQKVEELAVIYEAQKLANERYQQRGKSGASELEEPPSES